MKNKNAFTMAEALIVLSVVGILAALSVVAVNNSKPDENIIMFRKGYATATKITQNMLNDTTLYPNANSEKSLSKLGSAIDNKKGLTDTGGTNSNNFAYNFKILANPVSDYTGSPNNNTNINHKFTTADGIYWEVNSLMNNSTTPCAYATMFLYGKNGAACSYDATNCARPTKFKLRIDALGTIKPVLDNGRTLDPVAATYLYYSKINKHSKIPRDTRWFT